MQMTLSSPEQTLATAGLLIPPLPVNGYVSAVQGFPDLSAVINGAPDLLVLVFGETGRHVRAAVGVSALPRNALVEIQMTMRISEP